MPAELLLWIPGAFCVDIIERISELNANSRNIPATILESGADTRITKKYF
jgi:hypothetical protein